MAYIRPSEDWKLEWGLSPSAPGARAAILRSAKHDFKNLQQSTVSRYWGASGLNLICTSLLPPEPYQRNVGKTAKMLMVIFEKQQGAVVAHMIAELEVAQHMLEQLLAISNISGKLRAQQESQEKIEAAARRALETEMWLRSGPRTRAAALPQPRPCPIPVALQGSSSSSRAALLATTSPIPKPHQFGGLDDETCNQALAKSETFVMTGDDEDCNQSEVYAPTVTSISSNPAIAGPRPKRQVHEGMVVECGLSWLANGQLEEEEEPTGTNIEGAVRGVTTRGRRMKEISAQDIYFLGRAAQWSDLLAMSDLLSRIKQGPDHRDLSAAADRKVGWIYIYRYPDHAHNVPSALKGAFKIGLHHSHANDDVMSRMGQWTNQCGVSVELLVSWKNVRFASTTESLIHIDLRRRSKPPVWVHPETYPPCKKCQKRHSEWYRALYDGDETNVPAYLQKAVNFWVNHTYQNRWLPKDGGERPVSYEFDASKKRWHAKEV
uniref:Uncharacterized protein n=2 Tax=Dunaliella tertiolecta TaxID=3047 RepID=A0A7S3VKP6_DUNTE|mmetsp:Transcript_7044/g.18932  ORF Transcript_7044/g.18932 Transcript_7044/m.18932 type:complete len:492 (+) Transcript_7044:79-1554(+)